MALIKTVKAQEKTKLSISVSKKLIDALKQINKKSKFEIEE